MNMTSRGVQALLAILAVQILATAACDDPIPGPIGGLILVIRSFEANSDPQLRAIKSVEIQTERIEVQHSRELGGNSTFVTVDTQVRTIVIQNEGQTDLLVAQYQVPIGFVSQIRLYPRAVTVHFKNGPDVALGVPSPSLPSWEQSGWKLEPIDGNPWPVTQDQLTGVRVIFHFDERMLHNKGNGYKIKPTAPAEQFAVNPLEGEPGVFADQITIVLKNGVPAGALDQINAMIGATILISPIQSTVYRIKLPASQNLEQAFAFYGTQPEVQAVLPASNYGFHSCTMPIEGTPRPLMTANITPAWQQLCSAGSVGSYAIRVAVIDSGVPLLHPDLWMNIAIAQLEIPTSVRAILLDNTNDCDHDGIVSFYDLNFCPHIDSVKMLLPNDVAGIAGVIDAMDLIDPSNPWRDSQDNDGSGQRDDFVGWNFADNNADANAPLDGFEHGTKVAGIIGAIGDNGSGLVGVSWKVSIVPIRVNTVVRPFVTDVAHFDALHYSENLHVDVVNISQGLTFASQSADINCAIIKNKQLIKNIGPEIFVQGKLNHQNAFKMEPWYDNQLQRSKSQTLYVGSAGNVGANLGSLDIREYPIQGMKEALVSNVMIVGSLQSPAPGVAVNCPDSSYGTAVDLWASGQWTLFLAANGGITDGMSTCQTSYAAPVVSGAAALVLAAHPELRQNPSALRQRLLDRASKPATGGAIFQNSCDQFANVMPRPTASLPMLDIGASVQ